MTIRTTNLNASDFEAGGKIRTADGKLISLKHICIEEERPSINISEASKGDTLVLRCGKKFICTGENNETGSHYAKDGEVSLWFAVNGHCPAWGDGYDVVELVKTTKEPIVSLEGLQVGDRFRTRNGQVFTCTKIKDYGSPIIANSKEHCGIHFKWNGTSNMSFHPEYEAVERLKPSVADQISQQLNRLDKSQVGRVVVSETEWKILKTEVVPDWNGRLYVDGVRVLFTSDRGDVPPGNFDIQLKFR